MEDVHCSHCNHWVQRIYLLQTKPYLELCKNIKVVAIVQTVVKVPDFTRAQSITAPQPTNHGAAHAKQRQTHPRNPQSITNVNISISTSCLAHHTQQWPLSHTPRARCCGPSHAAILSPLALSPHPPRSVMPRRAPSIRPSAAWATIMAARSPISAITGARATRTRTCCSSTLWLGRWVP